LCEIISFDDYNNKFNPVDLYDASVTLRNQSTVMVYVLSLCRQRL
jgi:hypothetical protein